MIATIKLITSQRQSKNGYPIIVELFESVKKRPRISIKLQDKAHKKIVKMVK